MFGWGSKSPETAPAANPSYSQEMDVGHTDLLTSSFNTGSLSDVSSTSGDAELQQVLMREQMKAQFQAQVHRFNDLCWETCIDKPSSRLDGKTETCIVNCVDRFIDVNLTLAQRFAQKLQQSGGF